MYYFIHRHKQSFTGHAIHLNWTELKRRLCHREEKMWVRQKVLRGRLTFSSLEPVSAIISSLSFSMKGIRWPTAFFMTRADLMTCERTRMPPATSSPVVWTLHSTELAASGASAADAPDRESHHCPLLTQHQKGNDRSSYRFAKLHSRLCCGERPPACSQLAGLLSCCCCDCSCSFSVKVHKLQHFGFNFN